MALFGSTASAAPSNDVEVANPPTDSISSLAFTPAAGPDFLAAGSWDNNVRIYEVSSTGQNQGKAMYSHEGPVMGVCWNKDGNRVFSVGADKAVRMFDVGSGQSAQVGVHDAPIKCVRWIDAPTGGLLCTGSWDKTIKYWDLRTPNPVSTITLPDRVYTMDVAYPLLVVGTAERHIQVFNLTNPTTPFRTIQSPLKWQTRVVSCFPSAKGYAIGSIEGRVAIQYVDDKDAANNYSFRCHRRDDPQQKNHSLVFAINDIVFHRGYGTFATAGSDGSINLWDGDSRMRLKTFDPVPGPISTAAFSRDGNILAYAISYDWSKGHSGMLPDIPNKIMLHACKDDEVKRKLRR